MLTATRRSSLYRIALLCYAILVSQTAHAAFAVKHFSTVETPCVTKTALAQPQPRKKLSTTVKAERPAVPSTQATHYFAALLLTQCAATANVAALSDAYFVETRGVASQLRPYVLRL